MAKPRVLLADDHTMLLDAFATLLESRCEIVARVGDGQALLDAAREHAPDIVVADVTMPVLDGLQATRALLSEAPGTKVIILTVHEDPKLVDQALRAGASGFLLKSSAASELFVAIERVQAGGQYVTPLVSREPADARPAPGDAGFDGRLTARQVEVLRLLAAGKTMKEAGAILGLTSRTIAFHKYRMMEKLRMRTSAELVKYAIRNGFYDT